MVETRRLSSLVEAIRPRLDLPDAPLALALSGGADSAALGHLLSVEGAEFRCLHVHHGLPFSDRLAEAATGIAARLGIVIEVLPVEVGEGASAEAKAREVRYRALQGALRPGEVLLTAHTRDDQAETVMLNLLRGSGRSGLSGIPARSGRMARPLLGVTRSETRELATLAGLPYRDDPANLDPGIRRNVLRLEVLPELSARFNSRLVDALARAATHLAADEQWLSAQSAAVPVLTRGKDVAVALGELRARPGPVADRVLRSCIARVRPPYPGSAEELGRVLAVAWGKQARALLAGGVEVSRRGPLLVFAVEGESAKAAGSRTALGPGVHHVAGVRLEVDRVSRVCRVAPLGTWAAVFPAEVELAAVVGEDGGLVVEADGKPAWIPGRRRLPVAWYRPGVPGYLSAFAFEETGWTSSP